MKLSKLWIKKIGPVASMLGIVLFVLFVLLSQALVSGYDFDSLQGPDAYMRVSLVRDQVLNTVDKQGIYTRVMPMPGYQSHWTKPFDWLLIGPVKLLGLFTPSSTSLKWVAIWISPILGSLTLLVVLVGAKAYWHKKGWPFTLAMLLTQLPLLSIIAFGRADHHSLLILLFSSCLSVYIIKPKYWQMGLGCLFALSLWVSVESLVFIGIIATCLIVLWISIADPSLAIVLKSFVTCTLVAYLLEGAWRQGFALDTLSHTYLILVSLTGGLTLLAMKLTNVRQVKTPLVRAMVVAITTGVLVTLILTLLPDVIRGPFGHASQALKDVWLRHVSEVQPLWDGTLKELYKPFVYLAYLAPLAILMIKHGQSQNSLRGVLGLFLITFLGLSLYQIRWLPYMSVLALYIAPVYHNLMPKEGHGLAKRLASLMLIALLFVLPIIGGGLLYAWVTPFDDQPQMVDSKEVFMWLHSQGYDEDSPTLLTFIDDGPKVLYYTNFNVVSIPYHRHGQGILKAYDLMTQPLDALDFEWLSTNRVKYILLRQDTGHYYGLNLQALDLTKSKNMVAIDLPKDYKGYLLYEFKPR